MVSTIVLVGEKYRQDDFVFIYSSIIYECIFAINKETTNNYLNSTFFICRRCLLMSCILPQSICKQYLSSIYFVMKHSGNVSPFVWRRQNQNKTKNSFYVTLGKQLVNIHRQKNRPSNMKDIYFKSPTALLQVFLIERWMNCSSRRCWALSPHLSHFRIYLFHCLKVYPHKGKII